MFETPLNKERDIPAHSSVARVFLLARLVGEQTRASVETVWGKGDIGYEAEAEVLHANCLITDAELEKHMRQRRS